MTDSTSQTRPPKRGGWKKKLLWLAVGLLLLLVGAFFLLTSATFVKGVVLPKVGAALNADLAVADLEVSPFSKVFMRDVKFTPKGATPLFTAQEVRLRYSLMAILGGKLTIEEFTVASPVVTVVVNADGTSNLDPLTQAQKAGGKAPAKPTTAKSSAAPKLDITSVALKNATIRYTKNFKGGGHEVVELANANLTLSNLKNGATGKLELGAALTMDNTAPDNAGHLQAKLDGNFGIQLTADAKPASVVGRALFAVEQATGKMAELAALGAVMECETTPTEIKQLALRFTKSVAALGEVRVSGPFDVAKSEGRLKVEILALDRQVLNLAGAASGIDFGTTTINASSQIEITKGGSLIAAAGRLEVARFQVIKTGQTSPTLDLRADYGVTVDNTAESALVKSLNLTATQNSRPLLQSELTAPMTFAWGQTANAAGDAALNVTLTALNLADWRAFTGFTNAGVANGKIKLLSQAGGKQFTFDLDARVSELALALGENKLDAVAVRGTAGAQLGAGDEMTARTDLKVTADFSQPRTTLETRWQLDATVAKQVAQLRQCRLTLTPTSRAKNELDLTGQVDSSKAGAITGNLKLTAESLDLTTYYDLFGGQSKPADTTSPATPAPSVPAADPTKEPDAIQLPFRDFTFALNIGRLYLREVDIANWQTTTKLDGGKILLKPCALTLNGAPISAGADLDVGVPGYRYDVNLSAQAIPLAPLVNSFQPQRKDQIHGQATATAQIKGAGVTGASLQKNLAGQYSLLATNLNLSVANVRSPIVKTVINVIVAIPGLLRDPTAALGNLLGKITGDTSASKGGWADALTASPIDVILASGVAGEGRITLDQAEIRSPAFQALAKGNVTLAPILDDSALHIPVNVTLSRALAAQAGLVTADTPTNAAYVALPEFVTVKGTVGKPKADVDKAALAALALKSGASIANKFGGADGGKVGSVLEGVGSLLGGGKTTTTTNASGTATTNANPAADLLNLFKKPKK